jgi:hypothetical protein
VIGGGGHEHPWTTAYRPGRDSDVRIVPLEAAAIAATKPVLNLPSLITTAVYLSPDASQALGLYQNLLVWWDVATRKEIGRIPNLPAMLAGAWSPDGRRCAVLERSGAIRLYDLATRKVVVSFEESAQRPQCTAFTSDGKLLFVGGRRDAPAPEGAAATKTPPRPVAVTTEVHLFDAASGRPDPRVYKGPVGSMFHLLLTPDGATLIGLCGNSFGGEVAAVAWDVASARPLWKWNPKTPAEPRSAPGIPAVSKDGRSIAFGYRDSVIVADTLTGNVRFELPVQRIAPARIAFDPDARRIWTNDGAACRVWDAATGQPLASKTRVEGVGAFRFERGEHRWLRAFNDKLQETDLDK